MVVMDKALEGEHHSGVISPFNSYDLRGGSNPSPTQSPAFSNSDIKAN